MAVFPDNTKIHFGQKGAFTFSDGASEAKRNAYIARHRVREDWTNPKSAGALSRWILWERPNLDEAIRSFNSKFHI